jgi:hypothetical protein
MIRTISAALIILALSAPAQADEAANVAGRWVFTAQIGMGCDFGGQAFLKQISPDRYEGELTATQSCVDLPEDYIVRQECEASRLGDQLSIRCTVVEFMNGFSSEFYYPDNFTLTIASSERMHGALVSASTAPAVWQRNDGGIS